VLRFGYVPDGAPEPQINDTDRGTLRRAVVEIGSGQSGVDALAITAPLAGTGISAVEDGSSGRVVLEGDAAIAVYQGILRSIMIEAGGTLGVREVSIQVEDDQGATSEPAIVRLDYSTSSLIQGNDDPNTLEGTPGDDPISGLGADDQLFGREGNDLLDGGPGDDILEGGPGSDLLFGGPGRDMVSGDEGADRFFLLSLPDRGDILPDFDATQGDVLDLSALFDGQANAGNIDSFLRFDSAGGNDIAVSADIDGPAPAFDFLQVVTLADPTGVTTVQEAVNSGAVAV
jgi:Ca2+-binding RTX toxin-like protein